MQLSVLGPVSIDGRPVRGLLERRLVQALVAGRQSHLTRDRLIDMIWGELPPADAVGSLHSKVSRLRRQLGPATVVRSGDAYHLRDDLIDLDAVRFENAIRTGLDLGGAAGAEQLSAALALWGGTPFIDLSHDDTARAEAARLEVLREQALPAYLDLLVVLSRHQEVIAASAALLAERPEWEAVRVARARALTAGGQAPAALAEIEQYRLRLDAEHGLEPGAALLAAESAIRRGRHPAPVGDRGAAGAAGPPRPWRGSILRHPPLVGRESLLAELASAVTTAVDGRPRAVDLVAPSGMGKSRLLDEVVALAEARGARVVRVAGYEGPALPFDAMGQICRVLSLPIDLSGPGAGNLDPPDRSPAEPGDAEHNRRRLAVAVAEAVTEEAKRHPLVILVDDAHLLDPSSAVALQQLVARATRRHQLPLLVVAAHRPEGRAAALRELDALQRETSVSVLTIPPLSLVDAARLLELASGHRPGESLLSALHHHAEGSPLELVDTLAIAAAGRLLELRADQLSLADGADIPGGNRLTSRIDGLTTGTIDLVELLGLLRPGPRVADVADLLDRPIDVVMDQLEEADRAGLAGVQQGTIRFHHASYRAAVRSRLTPTAQSRWHGRIATRLPVSDDAESTLTLAWHLKHSGAPPRGPVRQVLLAAAEIAFRACNWSEAASYFELATGTDEADSTAALHAGQAASRCHQHHGADRWFARAVSAAEEEGDLAAWARATAAQQRGRLASSELDAPDLTVLADAFDRVEQANPAEAALLGALRAECAFVQRRQDEGRRWMDRAMAAAARGGPSAQAHCEFATGLLALGRLEISAASRHFRRAANLADREMPWIQSAAECRLALTLVIAGDWDRAMSQTARARELAESTTGWVDLSFVEIAEAVLAAHRGQIEPALAGAERAEAAANRALYPFALQLAVPLRAHLCCEHGDLAGAKRALDDLGRRSERAARLWGLAVSARLGDGSAEALPAAPSLLLPDHDRPDLTSAARAVIAATVAIAHRDRELAERAHATLRKLQTRGVACVPSWPTPIAGLLRELADLVKA